MQKDQKWGATFPSLEGGVWSLREGAGNGSYLQECITQSENSAATPNWSLVPCSLWLFQGDEMS